MTSTSESIGALRGLLADAAIAADAAPMAAYTKHRFTYLGVKTPARRAASKELIHASKRAPVDDVLASAHELRRQREREFHYVASDLLRANRDRLEARHLTDMYLLITTDSWWDTVDALASPTIGAMVLNNTEVRDAMDDWVESDDFWVARAAIIHQLSFKERTDTERLFRYSLTRAGDSEFFIRKAIGWALRQYARTDPDAVRTFVDRHIDELSPLTVREATKHL